MSTLPTAGQATVLPPIDLTPRRLTDDVFQSAEEAVLAEGQGDSLAAPDAVRQGGRREFSFTKAIQAHVAARPCQSALLAAAAGALAMLVIRSRLGGRLPPLRSPWLRRTDTGRLRR